MHSVCTCDTTGQNPKTIPTTLVAPIAGTIGGAVIMVAVATIVVIIIVLRSATLS